ncbi:DUF922 domain-containing protein [Hyunsoonleella sp. SJ7]|uniref:DUF922 domain-containing protein n=1 Tax=Hyunsoonleella aquatilis TaxID=2762758 RepID=A0A923HKG0_9FLAO|nr:DUF922 domain-containing protein [Hyunsoonleella aquatilis]MBC3759962.1 DUF922 domain-containing protein [Hyunsoonleella aquatilis]
MKQISLSIICAILVLSFHELRSGTPSDLTSEINLRKFEQTETEIEWSSYRKLKWEDFKGKPDTINFPNSNAVTISSIHFKGNTPNLFANGSLSVTAVFNQFESWVLSGEESDNLLKHEQLHFDITEIYARKIRKVLKEVGVASYKEEEEIWDMLRKIKYEYENRQKEYDSLTVHGIDRDAQEEWDSIVKSELSSYNLYKQK